MTTKNKFSEDNFNATIGNTVLCDGFLIPMTDFVLQQDITDIKQRDSIVKYANFLRQPLNLGMFVPCDEDGNILKEPKRWEDYLQCPDSFDGNKEWYELYDYQQAKEKVLFVFNPHFDISAIKHHILQDRNIEYLAKFGSMQLTKTALNAIFG